MTIMTNNPTPTEPAPADRDWFGGRRWTGIAAIGVLVAGAVCLAVVFLGRGGSNSTTTPSRRGGPLSVGLSRSASPALPTTVPTTAPTGVSWSLFETVALPSLPGAGPATVNGAIATGYAHTPLGALLAAVNENDRYFLADDQTWRAAADGMLARTSGYEAWVKTRAAHPYGPGGASGGGSSFAQVAGFQFVSYTPSDAVVLIVTRDSQGVLQVGAAHVTWVSGDWRYVLAPNGSAVLNIQQIDSLAGFIEWRGV